MLLLLSVPHEASLATVGTVTRLHNKRKVPPRREGRHRPLFPTAKARADFGAPPETHGEEVPYLQRY